MTHQQFHVSQQAVILNEDDHCLILKNTENIWLLPGGRIDAGEEDIIEALRRELKEETNLDLEQIIKPIGVDTTPHMSTYAVAFLCTVKNLEGLQLSDEHNEYRWIPKQQAVEFLYYKRIAESIKAL